MKESSQLDMESQFNSLNGGISMWLPHLAAHLVEHGVDIVLDLMQADLANAQERKLRDDFHFLIEGLKSINRMDLESAITPLKGPYQQLPNLDNHYQQSAEALKHAEQEWHSASQKARQQLDAWEKWACKAEVARRKKVLRGWGPVIVLKVSFELSGGSMVLDSPQRLQYNRAFFQSKVDAIRRMISSAYIADELPKDLSPVDFETAIRALEEHQEIVNGFSNTVNRASEEFESLHASYLSLQRPLLSLLWQMPRTAHWALFRICRPDLREPVEE